MNALTEYLSTYFDEVEPQNFYRAIFSHGELQSRGKDQYGDGKYNGIIIEVTNDMIVDSKGRERNKVIRHTLTDDLDKIDEVCSRDNFCLMSPVTYIGKNRYNENARNMYALVVEIDGLLVKNGEQVGIINLFHQINKINRIPKPTYTVSSGNGLHLYYVFERPIPLFKNIFQQLENLKKELTRIMWHDAITSLHNDIQYEPITQGFRVVGTATKKADKSIRALAFETGDKVTIDYLNSFVADEFKVTEFTYKSNLTLEQAKEKYPEWYDKRIKNGERKGTWVCNRSLYDWWKKKIFAGAKCGHRYWCLRVLSIYGSKCNVPFDEVEEDVFSYLGFLDSMTENGFEPFTEYDCIKSLDGYHENWRTYPIDKIVYRTGIRIDKNKRNGRKQAEHIKLMNFVRDELNNNTTWNKFGNGRKSKKEIVRMWRFNNPDGKKADCIRETGLSKPTVYKWWCCIVERELDCPYY